MSRALTINCGYSRVAIWEYSHHPSGASVYSLNNEERADKFKLLFTDSLLVNIDSNYWAIDNPKKISKFDRHCEYINNIFMKRWNGKFTRSDYLNKFSTDNWKKLSSEEIEFHSLSNCRQCATEHLDFQKCFPSLSIFEPETAESEPNIIEVNLPSTSSTRDESEVTREVLATLDNSYQSEFNHSFTESVVQHCGKSEGIVRKETPSHKKTKFRKLQRKFVSSISDTFAKKAAISFLSENESLEQYKRKRMSQSFELVTEPKHKKRHINDSFIDEYKDIVVEKLNAWPVDNVLNWSVIARQCNLPGTNAGQKVKELATECGIDLSQYKQMKSSVVRSSKCKLPGNEISVPSMPTEASLKKDIQNLIDTGELNLGEPCAPYILTKSSVNEEGQIVTDTTEVYGRKISLVEIRKSLLKRHEKYMRLQSDEEIDSMSSDGIKETLKNLGELKQDITDHHSVLKELQRSRKLVLWHDHSTILKAGYILMTIHTLYDPAVYMTTEEYEQKTCKKCKKSIQEIVEEPELYMICMCSSSLSDQLAIMADRIECLTGLNEPVLSSNNICVKDSLHFFTGDHPAQSFERGTQSGGHYKCGSCGCKSNRMDDLAHAFCLHCRSVKDLQTLALQGKFGKQQGLLKPFDGLSAAQLREELRARGVFDLSGNKSELTSKLQKILCGIKEFLAF